MTFESEIVECEVPNKNDHVYTKDCVEKALNNPVIQEQIQHGRFIGGFMEDVEHSHGFNLDLSKASHVLKEYWWEGNILYGTFETLDTTKGKALQKILNNRTEYPNAGMALCGTGELVPRMVLSESGIVKPEKFGVVLITKYELKFINFTEAKA